MEEALMVFESRRGIFLGKKVLRPFVTVIVGGH
jgi:hypothetical protein